MVKQSDLDEYWRTQAFDIAVDRALSTLHWCRVPDKNWHICDDHLLPPTERATA